MPQLPALSASNGIASQANPAQLPLSGRWLVLARVAWLSMVAVGITISTPSAWLDFARLQRVCRRAACLENEGLLRSQDLPTLEQVQERLLAVVEETMQQMQVSLWLRQQPPRSQPWQLHGAGELAPAPSTQHTGGEPTTLQRAPEGGRL